MSDVLDWFERISELFILKLLTLGAWCKAYDIWRTVKFYEDFLHDQTIDELINIYGRIIEEYLHSQSVDELIRIYGRIVEEYLHGQSVDEVVSIWLVANRIGVANDEWVGLGLMVTVDPSMVPPSPLSMVGVSPIFSTTVMDIPVYGATPFGDLTIEIFTSS
jgi:hypothetical protein